MINESIALIGIAQALFAVLVLGTRKKISVSNVILIGCLLAITLRFLAKLVFNFYALHLVVDISKGIIPLTFGPFLYLYTKYLTRNDLHFRKNDWLHFTPFAVFLFVCFVVFGGKVSFNDVRFFAMDKFLWIRIIFGLVFFSSVLIYTFLTYQLLKEYRQRLLEKPLPEDNTLTWLNFVSILFSALFMVYMVVGLINALTFSPKFDLDFISNIGLIILVYAVSYFGIKQPSILTDVYFKSGSFDAQKGTELAGKTKQSQTESDVLVQKLREHMESEKPYLQPNVSLADLAKVLDIPKSELTALLNNHMGTNFFTFVNEYRLQAVLEKLKDPQFDHFTILSIAYDCGFNSKSTFNGLFKQQVGMTPTKYRKDQQLERSSK